MDTLLKKVKDVYKAGCVSISLNTHRTSPDNEKDAVNLKNAVKEAEDRLLKEFDKKFAKPIIEKLNKVSSNIDHSQNLESMVIFVNSDFSEYTRLPFELENKVVIDSTFATRHLVRAMHKESAYYVLVLSRQKARLIEAYNDKAIRELKGDFPVDDYLYATDSQKLSNKKGQDNLIEEFFNKVDKTLLKNIKNNIHPVVIATEERNFHHYLKMADKKDLIIGNINRFKEDESPENIAKAAWPKVLDILKKRNQDRINELDTAVGQGKFLSDYNDIWNAIRQGKGKTLFVKKDFYQAAVIEEDKIIPVNGNGEIKNGHIDDIIDEMIEQNLSFGGDTVFLEGDEIEKFQNVALVTRY